MHIALDANEANVVNRVGSNVYAFELLRALHALLQHHPEHQVTVLLANSPLPHLPPASDAWRYQVIGPQFLWTQLALPIHLFLHEDQYDVFFTPGHYAPRLASIPYISSVMDLAFLKYPEQFKKRDYLQLKLWTQYSVKHAAKIITISEFTKQDIVKTYQRQPQDIAVAYPAIPTIHHPPSARHIQSTLQHFGISEPYLLYVGTIQPRKNLVRLVEAFEHICSNIQAGQFTETKSLNLASLQLVIAGKIGWLADDIVTRIKQSPFADKIILTGYVDEKNKLALLKKALATVNVGLYEGFGIPPLEGMQVGTIPIVSTTGSLPEVVGKAGLTVNPFSSQAIASGIKQVMIMPFRIRARYRREGKKQAAQFSWQASAAVVLEQLELVGAQKGKAQ